MTTELSKPVARRIGDLVVTIAAEGIRVRWSGRRKTATLPLDVLRRMLDAQSVRTRRDAMALPLPPGWCPRPGEQVFVSAAVSPGCSVGRVRGVRVAVPEPWIRVAVGPPRRRRVLEVILDDVRPLPAALAAPEPERPLFDASIKQKEP